MRNRLFVQNPAFISDSIGIGGGGDSGGSFDCGVDCFGGSSAGCRFGDGFRGGYAPPTPSSDREGPGAMRGVGGGGGEGMLGWGGCGGGGGTADGAAAGFGGLGDGLPRPFAPFAAAPINATADSAIRSSAAAAGSESVARSARVDCVEREFSAGSSSIGSGTGGSGLEWAWEVASGPGPEAALMEEYSRE
jgi:hypothetical protein